MYIRRVLLSWWTIKAEFTVNHCLSLIYSIKISTLNSNFCFLLSQLLCLGCWSKTYVWLHKKKDIFIKVKTGRFSYVPPKSELSTSY